MPMSLVLLAAGVALGWALHYRLRAATPLRLDGGEGPFLRRVRERVELLRRPYRPTPWLVNAHLQLGWQWFSERGQGAPPYDREQILTMRDGGTTALHWIEHGRSPATPTLVILHGLIGDAGTAWPMAADLAAQTGWRVVACTRRGHGPLPLTAARLNTLGCTDDLREQLAEIRRQFPESPLHAVGISAGTALLIRYLGEEGAAAPLRAAVGYCPAYSLEPAWARVDRRYSRYLVRLYQQRLLAPNRHWFAHLDSFPLSLGAGTLAELHTTMYALAGSPSLERYNERHDPMRVFPGIAVPLLLINAEDDPICVAENVDDQLDTVRANPNALLVRTRRGSHCTFYEGWRPRAWSHRLIAQYLQAAERLLDDAA